MQPRSVRIYSIEPNGNRKLLATVFQAIYYSEGFSSSWEPTDALLDEISSLRSDFAYRDCVLEVTSGDGAFDARY
ncbi:hypothetical protein [Ligilactobacillus equi]|uniref:Uncharacterized protein n=1 Tax=Ligilactobacillus equi DPC 6820 TaxID=1392007 RepID=V7HXH1_9LACO|nr:hypothetical protein [Ligilactobacillus equi]ETA73746.1 hypothetical protein LEQ_0049c [Ligilactobacillus equi DPC 6820]